MRRTPSSTEAEEVARIGRTPMSAGAAATLTTTPETLLSTNAGEPTRPTITSFWTRYGLNKIFGSGNGESQLVINIQSTTSLAEKTVRPFLSSKAVVYSKPVNKTSYFSSKMVVFSANWSVKQVVSAKTVSAKPFVACTTNIYY